MRVSVNGVSNDDAMILIHATEAYAKMLMPRMVAHIAVCIDVKDRFEFNGECSWVESGTRFPRVFVITLKNMRLREVLRTLAHEMVHVKQYARGELRDGHCGTTQWKDDYFPVKGGSHGKGYWFSPWEVEAYGMEVGMFELYGDEIMEKGGRFENKKLT